MNANDQQLVNALRGPMIMITIGVLFLLDNLTPFQIGQTWPILLIVVGLLALGGGQRRRSISAQVPPAYPGTYPAGFPTESFVPPQHPDPASRPGTEYRQ